MDPDEILDRILRGGRSLGRPDPEPQFARGEPGRLRRFFDSVPFLKTFSDRLAPKPPVLQTEEQQEFQRALDRRSGPHGITPRQQEAVQQRATALTAPPEPPRIPTIGPRSALADQIDIERSNIRTQFEEIPFFEKGVIDLQAAAADHILGQATRAQIRSSPEVGGPLGRFLAMDIPAAAQSPAQRMRALEEAGIVERPLMSKLAAGLTVALASPTGVLPVKLGARAIAGSRAVAPAARRIADVVGAKGQPVNLTRGQRMARGTATGIAEGLPTDLDFALGQEPGQGGGAIGLGVVAGAVSGALLPGKAPAINRAGRLLEDAGGAPAFASASSPFKRAFGGAAVGGALGPMVIDDDLGLDRAEEIVAGAAAGFVGGGVSAGPQRFGNALRETVHSRELARDIQIGAEVPVGEAGFVGTRAGETFEAEFGGLHALGDEFEDIDQKMIDLDEMGEVMFDMRIASDEGGDAAGLQIFMAKIDDDVVTLKMDVNSASGSLTGPSQRGGRGPLGTRGIREMGAAVIRKVEDQFGVRVESISGDRISKTGREGRANIRSRSVSFPRRTFMRDEPVVRRTAEQRVSLSQPDNLALAEPASGSMVRQRIEQGLDPRGGVQRGPPNDDDLQHTVGLLNSISGRVPLSGQPGHTVEGFTAAVDGMNQLRRSARSGEPVHLSPAQIEAIADAVARSPDPDFTRGALAMRAGRLVTDPDKLDDAMEAAVGRIHDRHEATVRLTQMVHEASDVTRESPNFAHAVRRIRTAIESGNTTIGLSRRQMPIVADAIVNSPDSHAMIRALAPFVENRAELYEAFGRSSVRDYMTDNLNRLTRSGSEAGALRLPTRQSVIDGLKKMEFNLFIDPDASLGASPNRVLQRTVMQNALVEFLRDGTTQFPVTLRGTVTGSKDRMGWFVRLVTDEEGATRLEVQDMVDRQGISAESSSSRSRLLKELDLDIRLGSGGGNVRELAQVVGGIVLEDVEDLFGVQIREVLIPDAPYTVPVPTSARPLPRRFFSPVVQDRPPGPALGGERREPRLRQREPVGEVGALRIPSGEDIEQVARRMLGLGDRIEDVAGRVSSRTESLIPPPARTLATENAAAVRVGGRVFRGSHHFEAATKAFEAQPPGANRRTAVEQAEHGFITNTGAFISRREAASIAERQGTRFGVPNRGQQFDRDELLSEQLNINNRFGADKPPPVEAVRQAVERLAVPTEAIPGSSMGGFDAMRLRATEAQQREFTNDVLNAVSAESEVGNMGADLMNLVHDIEGTASSVRGQGMWEGVRSPNEYFVLDNMPTDPALRDRALRTYMGSMGLLLAQDAMAWFKALPQGSEDGFEGVVVRMRGPSGELRPISPKDWEALSPDIPQGGTINTQDGYGVFINYDGADGFVDQIAGAAGRVNDDLDVQTMRFEGELYGPRDYLASLQGDQRAVQQTARILDQAVIPVWERWAGKLGAEASELDRIRDISVGLHAHADQLKVRELLDAEVTQVKAAAPKSITVAQAAEQLASGARSPPKTVGGRLRRATAAGVASIERIFAESDVFREHGFEWYTASNRDSFQQLRLIMPELDRPQMQSLYNAILAITSSGQEVVDNWDTAARVMDQFLRTGELRAFDIDAIGLTQRLELEDATARFPILKRGPEGQTIPRGEPVETGPPIQTRTPVGFPREGDVGKNTPRTRQMDLALQNLGKALNTMTDAGIDDAAARERLRGILAGLVPSTQARADRAGVASARQLLDDPSTPVPTRFRPEGEREGAIPPLGEAEVVPGSTRVLGKNAPKIGAFFLNLEGMSAEATVDLWMKRWWDASLGDVSRAGKGLLDAPRNASEAREIRQAITDAAQAFNAKHGTDLTVADAQAAIWYDTKREFAKLGSTSAEDTFGTASARFLAGETGLKGAASREVVGALAGGGLGGAAGAAIGPDEGRFGRVAAGAAAGAFGGTLATAGALSPSRLRQSKRARIEFRAELERIAAGAVREIESGPASVGEESTVVNLGKILRDPKGEQTLKDAVDRVVESGAVVRERIGHADVKEAAKALGLSDEFISSAELRSAASFRPEELVALQNIIKQDAIALAETEALLGDAVQRGLTTVEIEVAERQASALMGRLDSMVSKFSEGRSLAGRRLNALRIMAEDSLDYGAWITKASRAMRVGGVDNVDDAVRIEVRKLIAAGDKDGLAKFVDSLYESTLGEQIAGWWKAGLLTSPTTHGANILGNTTMATLEQAKDYPAAMVDWVISRHILDSERTIAMPQLADITSAVREGSRRGVDDAIAVARGERSNFDEVRKADHYRQVIFSTPFLRLNKALNFYTAAVFRSLEAEDAFFKQFAVARSLRNQARVMEGRGGGSFADLLASPTDDMVLQAIEDAEKATFTGRGLLSSAGGGVRRAINPKGREGSTLAQTAELGFEVVVPFRRTPANVATAVVEFSPFGMLGAAADTWDLYKAATRNQGDEVLNAQMLALQRSVANRVGRSVTGTVPLAIGMLLAHRGIMSTGFPKQGRERNKFQLRGQMENSILLNGKWRSLERISPWGNLMILGAHIYDKGGELLDPTGVTEFGAANLGNVALELAASAGGQLGQTITEQSFLRGIQESIEATRDPGRFAGRFMRNTAASFLVPNLVRRTAFGLDPTMRDTGSGIGAEVQSRIPIASRGLPSRLGSFGEPRQRTGGLFRQLFDPFSSREDLTSDPLIGRLTELGVSVPRLAPVRQLEGETDEQLRRRMIARGRATRQAAERAFNSPAFLGAITDEERIDVIEGAMSRIRGAQTRETNRDAERGGAATPEQILELILSRQR